MIFKSAPHLLASEDIESLRALVTCFERAKKITDHIGIRLNADGERVDYIKDDELRQFLNHMSSQFDSFRVNLRMIENNSKEFDPDAADDVSREKVK